MVKAPWHLNERPHKRVQRPERKRDKSINEANEQQLIKIAFNPLTEEFSVANASSDNNPEFISNISDIWASGTGTFSFINDFINQLAKAQELDDEQRSMIANNIQQLENIRN